MADASSSGPGSSGPTPGGSGLPGLGDLMAMFGGANLFNGVGKSIEQFKRGVNDFLVAVENFNETMRTLNSVATRFSALLDDVEEPVRAFMPQMTRSIKAADTMINQISGPIEKVAPGISRLAETLSSPVLTTLPNELAGFIETIGDVARRLQPLSQMAESAGSMFGLRALNALRGNSDKTPAAPVVATIPPPPAPLAAKQAGKQAAAKQAAVKKAPIKKVPAKKAPAKRAQAEQR